MNQKNKAQSTDIRGVILDVDGTLVDSNDAHAHAWVEAMKEYGYPVPFERVRPLIGMGGDKVLPELLNISKDSPIGLQISQRRKAIFKEKYLPTLKPCRGAWDLLQRMHSQGLKMVIATSAEPDELNDLLHVIHPHAEELFENETTSKDVSRSKPDPDIMKVAIQRIQLDPQYLVMLGDTAYDIEAASKEHIPTIAFRCGGWRDEDLKGAVAIYNDPQDLLEHYDTSPLVKGVQRDIV